MAVKGSLYVVATPIGNLSDITLRALEVLKSVNLILSEDTRETKKILDKFEISASQRSYRDQNHIHIINDIINLLEDGKNIALVSDSGTPVISDPGFKLVEDLSGKGFNILSVPGPSAVVAALSISGLPTDKFSFLGFLPKKPTHRAEILKTYGILESTLIIYESPYRVKKLLVEIKATLGNRRVCIVRELTKMYEEIVRGDVEYLINSNIKEKGEFVVLVAKEGYGKTN
jgi:16S rRNA (cytidine1402-2'-O)-methyltransferase